MRLTAKSEYGVLAAIDLACNYGAGPVSAREIAERREIPPRFLEQLFVSLRRAGIVTAVRGAKGGFVLTRDPSEITVLDVVEALEGPLAVERLRSAAASRGCGKSGIVCRGTGVGTRDRARCEMSSRSTTLASLAGTQETFDRRVSARDE